MSDEEDKSYDGVPYESLAYRPSHPDTMAMVATLFGMTPAPVTSCRVLELGCAAGFNLIPMAATLPESQFVGIDLSARQISQGVEAIRALGLKNIELRQASVMDVGEEFGLFDYIVSHGVFSWVSDSVREKILEVSARNLNPQGVAYVSYNCFPGWHLASMIREMMLYHTQRFTDPAERVREARTFLHYLAIGALDPNSSYARLLEDEATLLSQTSDAYVSHDHLERVNKPVFFHEFAERAAARGLQYIWESNQEDRASDLRKEVKDSLDLLSTDLIRREQNVDFLINRRFRMSLLCHGDVKLDRTLPRERMSAFKFVGLARPQSASLALGPGAKETFGVPGGRSITVESPVHKATLACLYETSPSALSFDELCDAVGERLKDVKDHGPVTADTVRWAVGELMRLCVWPRLVELHIHPGIINTVVDDHPVASPVARYQAKSSLRVTNLRHDTVALSLVERSILPHLDGQHDRAQLLDLLVDMAESQRINVAIEGKPIRDREELRSALGGQLDASLRKLALASLIVH